MDARKAYGLAIYEKEDQIEKIGDAHYSADHKFLQNSFGFLLAYLTMSSLNLTVL